MQNPLLTPAQKVHQTGNFSTAEVTLANRNNGTLLETLQHDVTPIGAHYLLNHFDVPYVTDAAEWSIAIEGVVEHPLSISLEELKTLATTTHSVKTLRVTLECAGNGRANLSPRWPSQPWQVEAVGTSDWTGVPLRHLLAKTTLESSCKELVFHGADQGIDSGKIHHFARSLKVSDAMHDDVMLVWQMNQQPLLPQHGFPLRLVVPGWYGMASVKWLNKIEAIDHAFDGHQQTGTYVYRTDDADTGTPVTTMRVKSLMVPPGIPDWSSRKRLVKPGPQPLTGRAWSGQGVPITKVEWSCNGEWQDATVHPVESATKNHSNAYAWCKWSADWHAGEGKNILACRATDANGNTQPIEPPWDKAGFGNNAAQTLEVWCENY